MKWQPIETAPKDGSPVDLWITAKADGRTSYRQTDCTWGKSGWWRPGDPDQWVHHDKDPDEPWRQCLHDVAYGFDGKYEVTHWMRVEPPK